MAITPTPVGPLDVTTAYQTLLTVSSTFGALLKGIWIVNYSTTATQVGINIVATAGTEADTNALRPYSASLTVAGPDVEYWSMDYPLASGRLVRVKASANSRITVHAEYGEIT